MRGNIEMIEYAQWYVWETWLRLHHAEFPTALDVSLNRSLQYLLCGFAERTARAFGEVTRRDVAGFIEHWIAAQGTSPGHDEPHKTKD